jgi:hypothetical protein
VAERLGVTQQWRYHRIYTHQIGLRRDAATNRYLVPDHPDPLAQLEELKLGIRTIVPLDREYHYE